MADEVLELSINLTARQALDACRRHGLTVRSRRQLAGHRGSNHWHLGFSDRAGTLELSEVQGQVWVKVHPLRDGGWASAFARKLAAK